METISEWGAVETLSNKRIVHVIRRSWRRIATGVAIVLLAAVLWDLFANRPQAFVELDSGRTTQGFAYEFFRRLFFWAFVGMVGLLLWSSIKVLKGWIWRLSLVVAVAVAVTLILKADALDFIGVENAHADPIPSIEVSEKEYGTRAVDNKIDDAVDWMVSNWRDFFIGIRDALLKVMLPLETRLVQLPWWAFTGIIALLAWRISGTRVALLAVGCLLFLAVFGLWGRAMSTLAVVGTATFISVAVAIPVGIAMSKSNKLEGALRPVLDMMQVMPSFVYLIPAIFFLGLGLVPAMLATMVYAMPPAMRLTNLGIRLVSPQLKETAQAFGTTGWQMLLKVELPMARPTIMAGVNQTIMMALAMVVIASLVGSRGLGKDVLAGIAQLETGRGLMAGLGIVAMAIVIDRLSQGFAKDPTQGSK